MNRAPRDPSSLRKMPQAAFLRSLLALADARNPRPGRGPFSQGFAALRGYQNDLVGARR